MSSRGEPVSAVIPAFNEEKHIGGVLATLEQLPIISQIIVVDDGSTDGTAEVVEQQARRDRRIQLLRLPNNGGKGSAMRHGADAARNDLILFLDADLIDVRPEQVSALIEPVRRRRCTMTLGVFRDGRRPTDWSHRLFAFLSGQRCLRWSHYCQTPDMDTSRWGAEMALNLHAWRHHYPVRRIPWSGATHAMRTEKHEGLAWYWSHVVMWLDIGRYVARHFLWHQVRGSFENAPRRDARQHAAELPD